MEAGPGRRGKQMRAVCHSLGWVSGGGHPEPSLEGEKEPASPFPAQQTSVQMRLLQGQAGHTCLEMSYSPRKKLAVESLVCCDRQLGLHPVNNELLVESFNEGSNMDKQS